jgi:hypothetical protein
VSQSDTSENWQKGNGMDNDEVWKIIADVLAHGMVCFVEWLVIVTLTDAVCGLVGLKYGWQIGTVIWLAKVLMG